MSSFCSSLPSSQNDQTEKTIYGVKVSFPCKPYPSQLAMMAKILIGLKKRQSCLLESPTGSGKTLALLCASLAWQKAELDDCDDDDDFQTPRNGKASGGGASAGDPGIELNRLASLLQQSLDQVNKNGKTKNPAITSPSSADKRATQDERAGPSSKDPPEAPRVPKIFFGTRTHKQISQVIRELRKTVYANTRMTVLASREHTCIHPVVSKNDHKNENCADMIKNRHGSHCRFYHNSRKQILRLPSAWDIEDIVKYGKSKETCPYFMTRDLLEEAQIVFCPYNYLVDPQIRRSMHIDLKNQIVILDEAHNIEDTAREAASFSLTAVDLSIAIKDLDDFREFGGPYHQIAVLKTAMESLSSWIMKEAATIRNRRSFGEASNVWHGVDMVAALSTMKLGPDTYRDLIAAMKFISEFSEKQDDPDNDAKLSAFASHLIEGLLTVLEFLYRKELAHMDDYRVALVVTKNYQQNSSRWKSRALQGIDTTWNYTLNFWCLNPTVAFSDISEAVRCIVLTSGTLSPMKSFQSELGVNFPVKLEANHVIDPCQAWVGQVTYGPGNQILNGSYKYSETFVYQDEIGNIVHRICSEVPHGVLCFFPSYNLLKKITERWQITGLYKRLEELKVVVSEPQGSKKDEFSKVLTKFYSAIDRDGFDILDVSSNVNGALLLAVCRGKVSEGLDFSDNNARAVITVGIPFPSIKDLQVTLKKNYNDSNWRKKDLLNGKEWYEIQAFRALNQALGRCIRHRQDWGVLFLVDSRIGFNEDYQNCLSRWVRSKLKLYNSFSDALNSLHDFIDGRKALEKCPPKSIFETKTFQSPMCSTGSTYGYSSLNVSPIKHTGVPRSEESPSSSGPSFPATSPDLMTQTSLSFKTPSPYQRKGIVRKLLVSSDSTPRKQQDNCEITDDGNTEDATTRMDTDTDTDTQNVTPPCGNVVVKPSKYNQSCKNPTNNGTKKRNPKGTLRDAMKRKKPFEWEDDPVCRAGVWCTSCGQQLVSSLEDVRASMESLHITKMADHQEDVKGKHFCECIKNGTSDNRNTTFIKNGDSLKENCDRTLGNLGCSQNALWSEEDGMCFQQILCKSCRIAIGYQVMATRNSAHVQCDQVWFIPGNTAFCLKDKPIWSDE